MKLRSTTFVVLTLALTLAGCASRHVPAHDPVAKREPPAEQKSTPEGPAPRLGGPSVRGVEFPVPPGTGEPREVRVLVDEPPMKLVTIVLRRGTVLPEHHSAVPVTIQALEGSGTVIAGKERLRIDRAHAVVLAENVPHTVKPDGETDLVLLVHHHGRGEENHHHE